MTKLYVRFEIPVKKWLSSNQRLNYMIAASKSSWIVSNMQETWKAAIEKQFNITPIIPDDETVSKYYKRPKIVNEIKSTKNNSSDNENVKLGEDGDALKAAETRLIILKNMLEQWKALNEKAYIKLKKTYSLKHNDSHINDSSLPENNGGAFEYAQYLRLKKEREELKDRVNRQSKNVTSIKKAVNKTLIKNITSNSKALKRAVIKATREVNANNRLFNEPVRFRVRIHNISKHYFDSPNSYPTIKPLQDAGTNTGILWEDDNNSCVQMVTFQGAEMLSKENYVVDIIVETLDEPLQGITVFDNFEKYL